MLWSGISSTEKEFNEAKEDYQKALNESGYNFKLSHVKPTPPKAKQNRSREIT